jgi:hypothetical protein
MKWLTENWYIIFGLTGGTAWIGYQMSKRDQNEPFLTKLVYSLAPVLDPKSDERKKLTPRVLFLFGIGICIALLVMVFAP